MRWFVLSLFLINNVTAKGISDEALGPIYTEALWFMSVVGVMAVISFVISSRNAKKYEIKMLAKREREKREEVVKKRAEVVTVVPEEEPEVKVSEVDRLLELSKLHKEGLLSKDEFMAFKMKLYRELEEINVNR